MAANRKLGCLSIFLFVALCASLFINLVLMVAAFQRLGGIREPEPIPRFREILLQKGARATTDEIAVITMRGLISSLLPVRRQRRGGKAEIEQNCGVRIAREKMFFSPGAPIVSV
jgi:hypothetical protein